jgi:hypothetical protein
VQVVLLRRFVELADHVGLAQHRLVGLERPELLAHVSLQGEFRLDLRDRRSAAATD